MSETDETDETGGDERLVTTARRVVDAEWLLWQHRNDYPCESGIEEQLESARKWTAVAPAVFKLRYSVVGRRSDSCLTRWFGTGPLARHEMRRRDAQLDGEAASPSSSPLTDVCVGVVVVSALLLVALVAAVAFHLVGVYGCASADDDRRPCEQLDDVWVWTNCSDDCAPDGYENEDGKLGDGRCMRALWDVCYGPDACWASIEDPYEPPERLECADGLKGIAEVNYTLPFKRCNANTTYCHVFVSSHSSTVHYGCFEADTMTAASDTAGCGKSVPTGGCQLVTVEPTSTSKLSVGQLCCCYGHKCNSAGETVALLAVHKAQTVSTCLHAHTDSAERSEVELLDDPATNKLENCSVNACFDWFIDKASGVFEHGRGCRVPHGDVDCLALGAADGACVNTTHYSVCCCRGDGCTADNAFYHRFGKGNATSEGCSPAPGVRCASDDHCYELLDGAPDDGDRYSEVERGCASASTRVPAAAVAAACTRLGDGCFATRDVDGAAVSVCCCTSADCTPPDVRAFVSNAVNAMAPSEAVGLCAWVQWAAAGVAALVILLLAALLVGVYILHQFQTAVECDRWNCLMLAVSAPPSSWPDDFYKEVDRLCTRVALTCPA